MIRLLLRHGVIAIAGALLCGCNRQSTEKASATDPFAATSATKGDKFGKGFGKAARADPNSVPMSLNEIDLPPVSYTTEPVEVR